MTAPSSRGLPCLHFTTVLYSYSGCCVIMWVDEWWPTLHNAAVYHELPLWEAQHSPTLSYCNNTPHLVPHLPRRRSQPQYGYACARHFSQCIHCSAVDSLSLSLSQLLPMSGIGENDAVDLTECLVVVILHLRRFTSSMEEDVAVEDDSGC